MSQFNFGNTSAPATPSAPAAAPAFQPSAAPAAPFAGAPAAAPVAGADPFAGFNGAKTYASAQYFDLEKDGGPGVYVCRAKDIFLKQTRESGPAIIVEWEVVQSSNPGVPIGSTRGDVSPLNKKDMTAQNLIAMIAALYGFNRNQADHLEVINGQIGPKLETVLKAMCYEKILNDHLVTITTMPHVTRQNKHITKRVYSPAPGAIAGVGIKG